MQFNLLPLDGAYLICVERYKDKRGSFARVFCEKEFLALELESHYLQANISTNILSGTIRGLHFQVFPHSEVKLVHCISGKIFDVIVDLRKDSPSFHQWYGIELSEENGLMLYVPKGFAHGYQSLTDNTAVHYMVSAHYAPDYERGLRYNDPSFCISWPIPVTILSKKDAEWPLVR